LIQFQFHNEGYGLFTDLGLGIGIGNWVFYLQSNYHLLT